jgi:hypothetical protein
VILIGIFDFIIKRKKTPTILDVSNGVDNEVTISTTPNHLFHSYIVSQKDLKLSESGHLYTNLPTESNIKKVSKKINSITKDWDGFSVSSYYRNSKRTTWIDRFNRYIATKIENPFSSSYTIRGDIVELLSNKGEFLVQCENAKCEILIPNEVNINLNDFSILKKKESKS